MISNVVRTKEPISPEHLIPLAKEANDIHETLGEQFRKVNKVAPHCLGAFSRNEVNAVDKHLITLHNIAATGDIAHLQYVSKAAQRSLEKGTTNLLKNQTQCTLNYEQALAKSRELSELLDVPFEGVISED